MSITPPKTYSLAFTAAAMRYADFMQLVKYVQQHQLQDRIEKISPQDIVQRNNERTSTRILRELLRRYRTLTPCQQELLPELPLAAQRQLIFLAICETYRFIADFTLETVRDKFEMLDFSLNDADYYGFRNRKLLQH